MAHRAFAGLAVLALLFVSLPASRLPAQGGKRSFQAVVDQHFRGWDANSDGALSHAEVESLVASHKVKGEEAAAVASIHVWFRNHAGHAPLTPDFFKNTKDGKEERRDVAQKSNHLQSDFNSFSKHLATVPRQVFTSSPPSIDGMSQGQLGDCYFVSTVGAFCHRDPAAIKRLAKVGGDGSTEVDFGDGRHTKVPPLTDSLICLGSSAHGQGLWLNVLEEGFGKVKGGKKGAATDSGSKAAVDKISKGGDPGAVIAMLTGKKADYLPVRKTPPEKLHEAMLRASAARKLISAGTDAASKHPLPPGIPGDHAYAVLAVKGNQLTIWNPWGNHFEPKGGPPGLQHGYKVEKGIFTMPFSDFEKVFSDVHVETDMHHGKR
ncbi:MAG: C2 family cysteine protease [Planctomycetota bacterium]